MGLITPDLSGLVDGQTADASDVKNPLNTIINEFNGNISANNIANNTITGQQIVNSVALTTPAITSPTFIGTVDGWINPNSTWTYASANTITVTSGAASIYAVGDKIKLTQTTVKYFYITGVADTVLTITGGTDYTLLNAAISLNYYSHGNAIGFPTSFTIATNQTFSMNGREGKIRGWNDLITNGVASYFATTVTYGVAFASVQCSPMVSYMGGSTNPPTVLDYGTGFGVAYPTAQSAGIAGFSPALWFPAAPTINWHYGISWEATGKF